MGLEMTKTDVLRKIMVCSKLYNSNLEKYNFLFIFKDSFTKQFRFIELRFPSANFLHLCGVKTALSPNEFYNKSLSNRLSLEDFELKGDTTIKKMMVLEQLMNIEKSTKMICDQVAKSIYFEGDIALGNVNSCMSFVIDSAAPRFFVPNSALKKDIRDVGSCSSVLALYKKKKSGSNTEYERKYIAISKVSETEVDIYFNEINNK